MQSFKNDFKSTMTAPVISAFHEDRLFSVELALAKTWQKPVALIKAFIDKRNGLSRLAWEAAYGDISRFLASDLGGTKALSVGRKNATSSSVGGSVNLARIPLWDGHKCRLGSSSHSSAQPAYANWLKKCNAHKA